MSSHEAKVWDTSDAADLAILLDDVTSQFDLSRDYSLKANISGIKPLPDTKTEIEQQFGYEIDPSLSSRIGLYLNQKTGRLILSQLTIPIIHENGPGASLNLRRDMDAPTSFYHPYLLLQNKAVVRCEPTWRDGWTKGLSANLLNGYGIDVQPADPSVPYRIWFGMNVLQKATSWELAEKMLLDKTDGPVSERVSVARGQIVPEDALESELLLSIVRETVHTENGRNIIEQQDQLCLKISQDVEQFIRGNQNLLTEDRDTMASASDITHYANLLRGALRNRSV